MDELDQAHVDAVAEEVNGLTIGSGYYQARVCMDEAREAAEAILTSTDPDVHAAFLAALVRAGVLDVEPWRVKCTCGKRLEGSPDEVEAWVLEHDDSPLSKHRIVWNPPSPRPWKRRYYARACRECVE